MMMIKDVLPAGAYVNLAQQRLMWEMFRIDAWSYKDENPFQLKERLDDAEKRMSAMDRLTKDVIGK